MLSPISFGRAIKINAPTKVADKIAKSANSLVTLSSLDSFTKSIFTDTYIARAKVVTIAPDEVYIFSGKEAQEQSKILRDLKEKIDKNDELISTFEDEEEDEKRKNQAIKEKYKEVYYAIFRMKKIVENGKSGSPKSTINVQLKTVKNPIFGTRDVIDEATYTSRKGSKVEKLEYKS